MRARQLSTEHAQSIHLMECLKDGQFKPLQCIEEHRVCWCVNDNGEELTGSRRVTTRGDGSSVPLTCGEYLAVMSYVHNGYYILNLNFDIKSTLLLRVMYIPIIHIIWYFQLYMYCI